MVRFRWRAALPAALLSAAVGAAPAASQAQPGRRPDPLNAEASVPPTRYDSTLARYRRHTDAKPVPWKEANDTVTRIGGWRAYAREATAPDAAASR